ncbi:sulfur carrier protein ThiS [Lachnospiraceae bacterium]|nr:sulfur carrier protein ThiS [Lachnospiraceae bacterium]
MKINGVQKTYADNISVSELLKQEGYLREQVAVELNEEIVSKDAYDTSLLKDSDVVEVVSFMGGGSR